MQLFVQKCWELLLTHCGFDFELRPEDVHERFAIEVEAQIEASNTEALRVVHSFSTSPSLARRVAFGFNDQVGHDLGARLPVPCAEVIEHRNHWLRNPQEQLGDALRTLTFTVSLHPLCG